MCSSLTFHSVSTPCRSCRYTAFMHHPISLSQSPTAAGTLCELIDHFVQRNNQAICIISPLFPFPFPTKILSPALQPTTCCGLFFLIFTNCQCCTQFLQEHQFLTPLMEPQPLPISWCQHPMNRNLINLESQVTIITRRISEKIATRQHRTTILF